MLKKAYKLTTREYDNVLSLGKRNHNEYFSCYFLVSVDGPTKCAVTIPKKVSKKALKRNNMRRKTFDMIEKIYPQLLPHHMIIIMVRKDLKRLDQEVVFSALNSILSPLVN